MSRVLELKDELGAHLQAIVVVVGSSLKPSPLNAWYAAAWSQEVAARAVLALTACGPVHGVLAAVQLAALQDAAGTVACPCRWARAGRDVVCRYRGLALDRCGRCAGMAS